MNMREIIDQHHFELGSGIANRMKSIVSIVGQEDNHEIWNTIIGVMIDRFDQQAQFRVIVTEDVMHVFSEELGPDGVEVKDRRHMGCIDLHIGGEVIVLANVMQLISDSVKWPGVNYQTHK